MTEQCKNCVFVQRKGKPPEVDYVCNNENSENFCDYVFDDAYCNKYKFRNNQPKMEAESQMQNALRDENEKHTYADFVVGRGKEI